MLTRQGIEAALLVPTPTGLDKSIFDATEGLREYLASRGYHDYGAQGQGQEHKVKKDAFLVRANSLEPTTVSLYRRQQRTETRGFGSVIRSVPMSAPTTS